MPFASKKDGETDATKNNALEAAGITTACALVFELTGVVIIEGIMNGDISKAQSYLPTLLASGGVAGAGYWKTKQLLKDLKRQGFK